MFKKYKSIFISILFIIIFFIVEFLYCNFKTIGNINTKSIINETKIEENDSYNIYSISLNNEYIKKLYINYDSPDEKEIKYTINDISSVDMISQYINLEVLNINRQANTINLQVDKDMSINDIKIVNKITFNTSLFLIIIVLVIIVNFIIKYKKELVKHLHVLLLIIFIGFGSIMIFTELPVNGYSWDDQTHFDRTIENISLRKYDSSNAEHGIADLDYRFHEYNTKEEKRELEKHLNKVDKERISRKRKMSLNLTSLSYLPCSLIYNFMKLININFTLRFKLAKLFMLIIYALVIAYAIKISPKYKILLFSIGLLPTNVFIAAHFNYDTFILAFILLGIAYYIKMMIDKRIDKKDYIVFLLSMSLGVLSKAIYIPLILLALFIPKDKFKDNKELKKYRIITIIVCVLILLAFIAPVLFSPASNVDTRLHGNVSVTGQIKSIIYDPVYFVQVFINNAVYNFFDKFFGVVTILDYAYMGIPSGNYLYYFVLIVLLVSYLKACDEGSVINTKTKIILVILLFFIIGTIWGALYLSFNDVGSSVIDGVQGRYFIPLLLPLFMIMITDKIKYKVDDNNLIIAITCLLSFIYSVSLLGLFIPFNM